MMTEAKEFERGLRPYGLLPQSGSATSRLSFWAVRLAALPSPVAPDAAKRVPTRRTR